MRTNQPYTYADVFSSANIDINYREACETPSPHRCLSPSGSDIPLRLTCHPAPTQEDPLLSASLYLPSRTVLDHSHMPSTRRGDLPTGALGSFYSPALTLCQSPQNLTNRTSGLDRKYLGTMKIWHKYKGAKNSAHLHKPRNPSTVESRTTVATKI